MMSRQVTPAPVVVAATLVGQTAAGTLAPFTIGSNWVSPPT